MQQIRALQIVILIFCLKIGKVRSVACYACVGESCRYGECTGTVCFSGVSPLGPHGISLTQVPIIKGCIKSIQNDTESVQNQSAIIFGQNAVKNGVVQFCSDGDYCNRKKFSVKGSVSGRAKTVCRSQNPIRESVATADAGKRSFVSPKDVCVGDWCWSSRAPLENKMFVAPKRAFSTIRGDSMIQLRGCSGLSLGISSPAAKFCISPPITDAFLSGGLPLGSLEPNSSIACYCRHRPLCNLGPDDISSLDNSSPLMHLTLSIVTPGGVLLTSDSYVWFFGVKSSPASDEPLEGRKQSMLPDVTGFVELEGARGFKLTIDTHLTAAGEQYLVDFAKRSEETSATQEEQPSSSSEEIVEEIQFEEVDQVAGAAPLVSNDSQHKTDSSSSSDDDDDGAKDFHVVKLSNAPIYGTPTLLVTVSISFYFIVAGSRVL